MPAKSHRSDYIILVTMAIIAALVVFALVSWGWLRKDERYTTVRTTHSTRSGGTMACYLLFERLGADVRRSERPLLPEALDKLDVLFVIDPLLDIEEGELASLEKWVRGGGVIVWSGQDFLSLLRQRRVRVRRYGDEINDGEPAAGPRVPQKVSDLPLAPDVAMVRFESSNKLDLDEGGPFRIEDEGEALFADSVGIRIVSHRRGAGEVIVLADSSFLANAWLGKEDNAILAANLVAYTLAHARGGRVAFDEYHFGFGSRETGWSVLRSSLMKSSPGWAVLCLMGAGILFLVYKGRRFGTRYAPARVRRRSKLEYVHSVGATYQAAGAHGLAFEIVYQWFRRKAASHAGLPPSAPADRLAAHLARRTLHDPGRYEKIIKECEQALDEPRLGARRASALIEQLVTLESEVFNGHRTRQ